MSTFGQPDPIAQEVRVAIASRLQREDPMVKAFSAGMVKDQVLDRIERINGLIDREEARWERKSARMLALPGATVDDENYKAAFTRYESTIREWENTRSAESATL